MINISHVVKILYIVFICVTLQGCSIFKSWFVEETIKEIVVKEYVEVPKPILYCPRPNWKEIDPPEVLAIEGITVDSSPGEVAKRYKATIIQLRDYNKRLNKSLQKYDETHKAYEQLRQEFLRERLRDGL